MAEKKTRQSRFDRRKPRENLTLSNFDVRIFLALHNHRYLRSSYLHALVGGEITYFKERVRDLYRAKFIMRTPEQRIYANVLNRPIVYELDHKGEEVLKAMGLWLHDLKKSKRDPHHEFLHDLGVNDASASIEIAAAAAGYTIRHTQQVLTKGSFLGPYFFVSDKRRYVPDWFFGVQGDQGTALYVLEFDRSTMPLEKRAKGGSSYERKLDDLKLLLNEGEYKRYFDGQAPSLLALHLFVSEERMKNAMQLAGPARYNLFKAIPSLGDVLNPPRTPVLSLFDEPWLREGFEPLSIKK